MKSSIIGILEILNEAKILNSAGFSAGYTFGAQKTREYFDELIQSANLDTPIFSGIMIIETYDKNGFYTVVDGLQRLTSLSLLLCALCESTKNTTKKNEDARYKIFTRYLADGNEVKLHLTERENVIYNKLVFSMPLDDDEAQSELAQSYFTFLEKIKEQKISATKLFKIISKIRFMIIFTDGTQLSARELYQSLNEDKSDMSQINLITSFISQNCATAMDIWRETIRSYESQGLKDVFKKFIRDFLTVQNNGLIPPENALYKGFKNYFYKISQYQPTQKTIENIYKYSQFYLKILQADFDDFEVQKHIISINENNGQDSYSYLMEVLDDLENGHIDRQVFMDILEMINSLLIARLEGQYTEISFASLSSELNRMIALKNYSNQSEESNNDSDGQENMITINEINQLSAFEV